MYVNKIDIINCINKCEKYNGQVTINKGDNMINDKKELIKQLSENHNKVYINKSMLCINGVNTYDDCDIRMIYYNTDDNIIEFCDEFGMLVLGIYLDDLIEFEQVCEYDEDGNVI